jgi:hypothetical protein
MIKGNVDLSWLDERELYLTKFVEETNTIWSGGYWKDNNMAIPDYPTDGPIVLQTYDEHAPSWAHKVKEMFSFVNYSLVTVNCVKPGRFIGPHVDKFFRLKDLAKLNKWDIEGKTPVRVNVFLQDKIMGHFLEIENHSFPEYSKGDYTYILKDQVHCVSNVSNINRYTLQITGYAKTEDIT